MVIMRPLGELSPPLTTSFYKSILFSKFFCLLSVSAFHIKIRTVYGSFRLLWARVWLMPGFSSQVFASGAWVRQPLVPPPDRSPSLLSRFTLCLPASIRIPPLLSYITPCKIFVFLDRCGVTWWSRAHQISISSPPSTLACMKQLFSITVIRLLKPTSQPLSSFLQGLWPDMRCSGNEL